jgi:CubicO group peptidase (beta-lactamase class C family)
MKSKTMRSRIQKRHYTEVFIVLLLLIIVSVQAGVYAEEAVRLKTPDEESLKAILEDFEQYTLQGIKDWQVPGMSIAIVQNDRIVYKNSFGVKTKGEFEPVTNETVFQIGSVSKSFTATLVAMLVDEGKVNWDDRVIDHLPDFMMYDPWVSREFRVKDLMAQNSGLSRRSGDLLGLLGYDRNYITNSLKHIKPVSSFRSEYAYQNHLFLVAAKLVESKTGKTWEKNIQERIFNPLGMNNSSMDKKSYTNNQQAATLHLYNDQDVTIIPMDWKLFDVIYIYAPAGGINSTVSDMAKWIMFNYNEGMADDRQLIGKETFMFLHTPGSVIGKTPVHPMQYYCQGWVYREFSPYPIIWHTGETTGCSSMAAFIPEADIGIVVLSNLTSNLPQALANYFFDRYFYHPVTDWSGKALEASGRLDAKKQKEPPVFHGKPTPPLPLDNYSGVYKNDTYGKITITRNRNLLVFKAGPNGMLFQLDHHNGNTFRLSSPDFKPASGFAVFETGAERNVQAVSMDIFNDGGKNMFEKVENK